MKTRILILALALLFVVQIAYATPSVTTTDLYNEEVNLLGGAQAPLGLIIDVIPETQTAQNVLEDVTAAIAGGQPVVTAYFADQQADLLAVLPVGTDLNTLQLMELENLYVSGYTADMGDLQAKLTFPTMFVFGKPVAVLVGLVTGDVVVWEVVPAVVNADGSITVNMTSELLLKVQAGTAVISVLQ